ncbi:MAG: sensor histidine kinase [Candidatus Kapabacteria bacterium]|nr:sensor histidine kinase [Candidatus Kapabacteria bacterium]
MAIKTSLNDKLIVYFILVSITAVAASGYLSFEKSKTALFNRTFDQLTFVRIVKAKQVEKFFIDRINELKTYSQLSEIAFLFKNLNSELDFKNLIYCENKKDSILLMSPFTNSTYFKSIKISSIKNRNFFFSISSGSINKVRPDFTEKLNEPIVNHDQAKIVEKIPDSNSNSIGLFIILNCYNEQNSWIGTLEADLNISALNNIMLETNPKDGLGISGESYIVSKKDMKLRTQSRFIESSIYKISVITQGSLASVQGKEGTSLYSDYRNKQVLGSYGNLNISGLDWCILAEIDLEEANKPILEMRSSLIALTILISAFVFIISFLFSKRITIPIVKLTRATAKIALGNYSEQIPVRSNDEIGELTGTFNIMIQKLKQHEIDLLNERKNNSSLLIDGMDRERKRLSRELHDSLGQDMIALKLKMECIEFEDLEYSKKIINEVKSSIDATIQDIRSISNNLMPSVLTEFGLINAIRNLCDQMSEFSNILIEFINDVSDIELDPKVQLFLYRIAQEAIKNTVQHSLANKSYVKIYMDGNNLIFIISDNGIGFDSNIVMYGNGLFNIKERVSLINGICSISSVPNQGVKIEINVPI